MNGEQLPAQPTCATCRYYKRTHETEGDCRRFPAQLVAIHESVYDDPHESGQQISWAARSYWPLVQSDDWCGEHRPTAIQTHLPTEGKT